MLRLLCFCLAFTAVLSAVAADRPNVVFIVADDLGWADTTLNGQTRFHQTPNLERLARRGMTFSRAYSASPLCSPTRASLLTGLSPARHGITAPVCHVPEVKLQAGVSPQGPKTSPSLECQSVTRLSPDYRTLNEAFAEAGYATGHFGKWHLGAEPYSPIEHGFDVDVPHHPGPGPAGSYVAPWKFANGFAPRVPGEHLEDRMAQEAVAFMERHRGRPFFLNCWMFSVHAPFDAKKALVDKHRARVNPRDAQRSPTYAAMLESLDDAVGTLLDALDRLQLAERTLIVFTSDNGGNMYNEVDGVTPTSNAPLRGGKATLYEGGIRVPLVVVWPGKVAAASRSEARVQSPDFFPTLRELLDLPGPAAQRFDGVSFAPALRGEHFERPPMFTYFPHQPKVPEWMPPAVSVHEGDWKLIRIFHGGTDGAHRWKLYNLADDLAEQHDLAAREPERVRALDARIEAFLNDTQAVRPARNPSFEAAAYRIEDEGRPAVKTTAAKKKTVAPKGEAAFLGWKPRAARAELRNGVLVVRGQGTAPFLGFGHGGATQPVTLTLRVRAAHAGPGRADWLSNPGKPDDVQTTPFVLAAGDWQTVQVECPAPGARGVLRLYLPAQTQPVEIDWVESRAGTAKPRRWDF